MHEEAIYRAKAELKRADHLIFVSLKYTRTVDVIKNIIERLINTYDATFDALLHYAQSQKKIEVVPTLPRLKMDAVKEIYMTDENIQNHVLFYGLLRKIDKATFTRMQEYRRHVTMIANIDGEKIEITIDIITDYFQKTKEFIILVDNLLSGVTQ